MAVILLYGVQHYTFFESLSLIKGGKSYDLTNNMTAGATANYWIFKGAEKTLSSSGATGSLGTVFFVLSSLFFASALKIMGTFDLLLSKIYKLIRGPKSLILVSGFTGAMFAFMSSDQSVGCNINPSFYVDLYDKAGVSKLNLSRGTDNTATVLVPLMPWSSDKGAFADRALGGTSLGGSLGMSQYMLISAFSFFNWLTALIGLIFVLLDLFQVNKDGKIQFRGGIKSYSNNNQKVKKIGVKAK